MFFLVMFTNSKILITFQLKPQFYWTNFPSTIQWFGLFNWSPRSSGQENRWLCCNSFKLTVEIYPQHHQDGLIEFYATTFNACPIFTKRRFLSEIWRSDTLNYDTCFSRVTLSSLVLSASGKLVTDCIPLVILKNTEIKFMLSLNFTVLWFLLFMIANRKVIFVYLVSQIYKDYFSNGREIVICVFFIILIFKFLFIALKPLISRINVIWIC